MEQSKTEPAYKAELLEERKRREQLERRVNELVEENRRSRADGRGDGARLGDPRGTAEARRGEDRPGVQGSQGRHPTDAGRAAGRADRQRRSRDEGYLTGFVNENPEFLPGRIQGGSGQDRAHEGSVTSRARSTWTRSGRA